MYRPPLSCLSFILGCLTTLSHQFVLPRNNTNPRASWGGFDINTNYYEQAPDTGVVREYFFDIQNTTHAPDGRERNVLLVNGQFPGPTIIADWGDEVVVHVTNSLQNNGSSLHFHGIRQLNTNQMDGVQSLTQCPIAPSSTYTYRWKADVYGSSWYHSHFSLQAWEGVYGGILINGPATAAYDEDLGSLFLSDWSVETVDAMYPSQIRDFWTPKLDGGLLNGTAAYTFENGTTVGKPLTLNFTPGKRYRLRLINSSVHTMYKFSIDNHAMTVIANDFVALQPFQANYIAINSGQRYDVIVQANQPTQNYWMRAVPQTGCSNNTRIETNGVVHYTSASSTPPTTTKQSYGDDHLCYDMDMLGFPLVPQLALNANTTTASYTQRNVSIKTVGDPVMGLWRVGEEAFSVRWNDPTLLETTSTNNPEWTPAQNVLEIDTPNAWTVFVIQNKFLLAHPIHLHGKLPPFYPLIEILTETGHDFWVLATGIGNYTASTPLNTINPPRKDTVTLPSDDTTPGFVVIAWPADNPGAWLLHCHVGFHAVDGFALQVLERKSEIPKIVDQSVLQQTCAKWNEYAKANAFGVQDVLYSGAWDSGV